MQFGGTLVLAVTALAVGGGVVTTTFAYRIIAYEPSLGHSHWNMMSAVLESLLDAGHEVVCATLHPATARLAGHPNYTHVDVSATVGRNRLKSGRDQDLKTMKGLFDDRAGMIRLGMNRARHMCDSLFAVPEMRRVLRDRFDAVIMESLFVECPTLLPGRLNASVAVYVVPSAPVNWMPVATGSPDHPSYLGTLLSGHPTPVTFFQRLANAADYVHTNLVRWYRDGTYPAARNTLVLVNTHHSVEPARPLGPNVVEIGGIHLRPTKPLSPDLAKILDNSNEFGVIVFTFGSFVAIKSLPTVAIDALKFVFSQLPQTVIWKYEDEFMDNKPENVILCKWLPQRDILQHPNVKLFISHGGMSGLYEVVDAGVPVLGIPLLYDQPRNIQNLVDIGMALSVDINYLTKTTISTAINRLLNDQSFSENAKRVSSLFRDRPVTAADSAVYWIERLIRHGETTCTRPLAADASWASHFLIDVCVALIVAFVVFGYCTRVIIHKICNALKTSLVNCYFVPRSI